MNRLSVVFLSLFLLVPIWAQKMPTREQIVEAGQKPHIRYTVPLGELKTISNSIFNQPAYSTNEGKATVTSLPRGTGDELGLTGVLMYNELCEAGVAVEVIPAAKSIILYDRRSDGVVIPLYFADCTCRGRPYFNRIRLVNQPPPLVTRVPEPAPVTAVVAQQPPVTQVVPGTTNVNFSPIPGAFNVNMTGLPQYPVQPAFPANTTQTIIYRMDRDWAAKAKDVGYAIMGAGIGTGSAAAGILMPAAIENSARVHSQGMVDAARNRVPDILQITSGSTASSSPTTTSTATPSQVTQQGGPSVINDVANNPTIKVDSQPKVDVKVENQPKVTANGGEGGVGGQGGGGGAGGAGGEANGGNPIVVAGSSSNSNSESGAGAVAVSGSNSNSESNAENKSSTTTPPSTGGRGGKDDKH